MEMASKPPFEPDFGVVPQAGLRMASLPAVSLSNLSNHRLCGNEKKRCQGQLPHFPFNPTSGTRQ
jgi:hypothetical protein